MAKAVFDVGIASETKQFEQGIRNGVVEPLEDAEEALTDLGKNKGPERLEREIEDAQQQTEDLRKEIKRTADEMDAAGRAGQAGFGKVQGAAQEVTQEIGMNAGQAVSSFRGDIEDLGQIGQDTLGGLAGTLAGAGPAGVAGAAVVAAGAAGLGMLTAELERQQEEADKLRDRLAGAYSEAAEAGRDYLDVAQIIAEANDLMFNPERADEWKRIQQDAKDLGLDVTTVLEANAGDLDAQAVVLERLLQMRKDVEGMEIRPGAWKSVSNQKEALSEIGELESRYRGLRDVTEEWKDAAQTGMQITSDLLKNTARDAGTALEQVDELGNKLWTLEDGTEILIEADTGRATLDLKKFKGDVDEATETVFTNIELGRTPDVRSLMRGLQRDLDHSALRVTVRAVLPSGEAVL